MKLEEYDKDDGKKVWPTESEVEEIIEVTPSDIVNTPAGKRVRVRSG